MILVFNASPLIVLAKAGLLNQIVSLAEQVIIPQTVVDEVVRVDDPADPARMWLERPSCPVSSPESPPVPPFLAAWDLGAGESAVISVGSAWSGSMVVLDDLAARRCAQAHQIKVVGSLGLVLLGKRQGLIPRVADALEAIQRAGLFVSPQVVSTILREAGE